MEGLFESFSEDVTKWEIIMGMINLSHDDELRNDHKAIPSIQLLPRQDVLLFGTIPKMEQKIYTRCKECRLVFNPKDVLSHKSCSGNTHSSTSHNLKKKIESKGNSSKKSHSNLPPPPLFKKSSSSSSTATISIPEISVPKVCSPKLSKISAISSTPPTITTITNSASKCEAKVSTSTSSSKSNLHSPRSPSKSSISTSEHLPRSKSLTGESSSSSSSKHKKSRKSNSSTKITKEFDPDVHCGVVEGSRGPCTRSITCSNHRIKLRKLVSGRSKDIHQLIAEKKTVKEKELKHSSNCSYTSPNGQAEEKEDSFSINTTYVPAAAAISNGNEPPDTSNLTPVLPKISEATTLNSPRHPTLVVAVQQPKLTEAKTMSNSYIMNMHSLESEIGTVPVVYMPVLMKYEAKFAETFYSLQYIFYEFWI